MRSKIHRMPGVLPGKPSTAPPKSSYNFRFLGIVLVLLGIFGTGYWFFFFGPAFSIREVEVIGVENESVRAAADRLVGGNMFRVSSTSVEQNVIQSFPPIENVTVVRGLPHVLRLNISLRLPKLRWQVNNDIYIVDSSGAIFEKNDKPEYANLPIIADKSGLQIQMGQKIVTRDFIQFVADIQQRIPTLFTQKYIGSEISETTFQIDILLEGDIRLRLTTQRPLVEQLESASQILKQHPEAKMIDVRVAKWGYWH